MLSPDTVPALRTETEDLNPIILRALMKGRERECNSLPKRERAGLEPDLCSGIIWVLYITNRQFSQA